MRIGMLGSGMVGQTLGGALARLGHDVMMGSRSAGNDRAVEWAAAAGAQHGAFEDAAAFGELVVNATAGGASLAALEQAGTANLAGKVLVDVANALDFGAGFPPSMAVPSTDSLAERIQRAHPDARVVKTLNTMNARVMIDPGGLPGPSNVFLSGDDADAKAQVRALLRELGWPDGSILDLGGLSTARGAEQYLPLWLGLLGVIGRDQPFNIQVVR